MDKLGNGVNRGLDKTGKVVARKAKDVGKAVDTVTAAVHSAAHPIIDPIVDVVGDVSGGVHTAVTGIVDGAGQAGEGIADFVLDLGGDRARLADRGGGGDQLGGILK